MCKTIIAIDPQQATMQARLAELYARREGASAPAQDHRGRRMSTPRDRYMMYARAFPGWERLRAEVASALGLPATEVCGLSEAADPTVRLEAHLSVMGFQLRMDLWVNPSRAGKLSLPDIAGKIARQLDVDIAYHDGSAIPVAYVVVRPSGQRFAAVERDDDSDGLSLDESSAGRPHGGG